MLVHQDRAWRVVDSIVGHAAKPKKVRHGPAESWPEISYSEAHATIGYGQGGGSFPRGIRAAGPSADLPFEASETPVTDDKHVVFVCFHIVEDRIADT